MDISETLEYIHSYNYNYKHEDLSRVRELLHKLGDPDRNLRFVHVAGTNGKGSTCAMLASILRKAGYRTGLFTSPHILRYNERMQIDGVQISDDDLARATGKVRAVLDSTDDKVNLFEMTMCTALVWFAEKKADIVVFEVGLGGFLDGTNVIDVPEVAVITNIGLDHTEILGNTLEEIAWQKAAIIKEGGTAVVYRGPREVEKVFEDRCLEVNAELIKADFGSISEGHADIYGQTFDVEGMSGIYIPLAGEHQKKNTAVAVCAAKALARKGWNISEEDIRRGLKDTVWPVRFEVVSKDPLFIIDGGHNPQCAEAVRDSLKALIPFGTKIVYLMGILADKDFMDVIKILGSVSENFVTVTPDSYRALDASDLAGYIEECGFNAVPCSSTEEGIRTAVRLADGGAVCCVGSLYLAGDVRRHFSAGPGFERLVQTNAAVSLRHFSDEDCEILRNCRYPDLSCSEIRRMISEWNTLQFDGIYFEMFAVISDGRPVGSISVFEHSSSACEIGPDIFVDDRGKGFASSAMELALGHAAAKGYRLAIQQVRTDNEASIGLHEKLGFEALNCSCFNRKGNEVRLYIKLLN